MPATPIQRDMAEAVLDDFSAAVARLAKDAFPNIPIRVLLQKGSGPGSKLGFLVYIEGESLEGIPGSYPNIHRIDSQGMRATPAGQEYLRRRG